MASYRESSKTGGEGKKRNHRSITASTSRFRRGRRRSSCGGWCSTGGGCSRFRPESREGKLRRFNATVEFSCNLAHRRVIRETLGVEVARGHAFRAGLTQLGSTPALSSALPEHCGSLDQGATEHLDGIIRATGLGRGWEALVIIGAELSTL